MAHAITKHDANLSWNESCAKTLKKDWLLKIILKNSFSQVFATFEELQFD